MSIKTKPTGRVAGTKKNKIMKSVGVTTDDVHAYIESETFVKDIEYMFDVDFESAKVRNVIENHTFKIYYDNELFQTFYLTD